MIWAIGIDDTDYPEGGCTTWHANDLEQLLVSIGAKPIERRLVRLWPFAVRRTRGNAALALIVEVDEQIKNDCLKIIRQWYNDLVEHIKQADTNQHARPGLIITIDGEMDSNIYWECVKNEYTDIERITNHESVILILESDLGRDGLIGAAAAISWRPDSTSTFEGIAWRNESMYGTQRTAPNGVFKRLESNHPNTFMNRDPTKNRGLISPRTPCPVLFGVRGWNHNDTLEAMTDLSSLDWEEQIYASAIHRTNQCSDDHLEGIIDGTVMNIPIRNRGGHVTLDMLTSSGVVHVVSFKEGGDVNREIGNSIPGDRIHALGIFSPEGDLHIERFMRSYSSPGFLKRPDCDCGGHLRTMGAKSDLRCKSCRKRITSHWIAKNRPNIEWVEPPVSSRRHLSKPISMMK